jgi:hypothetical protein
VTIRLVLQLPPKLSCSRCVRRLDLQKVQHARHDITRHDTEVKLYWSGVCFKQQVAAFFQDSLLPVSCASPTSRLTIIVMGPGTTVHDHFV